MRKEPPLVMQALWAVVGLLLTMGGTFLEAFFTSPPWNWTGQGVKAVSLGVTYQIGAVLLTGCMAGARAAAAAQIAYVVLGLTWLPVFAQGGGFQYLFNPSFGYILGFVAGAWVCGAIAHRLACRLEYLAFSSLLGLVTIHLYGLVYLFLFYFVTNWRSLNTNHFPLGEYVLRYSVYPLAGQLALVCAVAVLAFVLRKLMFY
jgi:biotin transport system substrate-specific component